MRKLWSAGWLVLATLGFVVAAGATTRSPSGETCTTTGNGSEYTIHISIPPGAQPFGFAFGAPGATITNAVIPGTNGSFSTQNLPPNTTGAWVADSPLTGSPDATLTITGTATGRFTIVPAGSSSQPGYLNPVTCTTQTQPAPTSVAFTVVRRALYDAAAHAWHLVVVVPVAGTVSAAQLEPTTGTSSSKSVTAKPLVQSRALIVKSAARITLTLRPTAKGDADLTATGAIKVMLHVTFDARNGRSATKLVALTLRK